jgi:hypothetical protein
VAVVVDFDAQLWLWDARRTDSWTFVSLPADASQEIRELTDGLRRGFGSVRVRATVGDSVWTTSIFPGRSAPAARGRSPDFPSADGAYVLPIKRKVRDAEGLDVGDVAAVTVELLDA